MVRKKQHNDGLVDGNIHSKKRPSTTKFQYPQKYKINVDKVLFVEYDKYIQNRKEHKQNERTVTI